MTKGIHRVTDDSKRGRQLRHAKGATESGWGDGLTKEQRDWNAQIEAKKKAKAQSK